MTSNHKTNDSKFIYCIITTLYKLVYGSNFPFKTRIDVTKIRFSHVLWRSHLETQLLEEFKEFIFFISSFLSLMYLFISSEFCLVFLLLWQQIYPSKFNTKFKISSQLALPFWNIIERLRPKSHSVLSVRLSKSENSFELQIFFES